MYSRFRTVFSCETLDLSIVPTRVLDLDSFNQVLCRNDDPVKDFTSDTCRRLVCVYLLYFIFFFFADRDNIYGRLWRIIKVIRIYFT